MEVPRKAVEAVAKELFALSNGYRMTTVEPSQLRDAQQLLQAALPHILDAFREELLGDMRKILLRRIGRYRSEATIFKRQGQIDEAVRLERAANVLGSALHEYDASLSTLGDSDG